MSHRLRKPNQLGFTMIEMMVGIAILGILAALAAPDFSATIKRYRIKSTADELRASFLLARSTAITRGLPVIIQSTGACKDNDWSCGWQMFVDADSNGALNGAESLLQVTTAPAGYTLTRTVAGASTLMIIDRWGRPLVPIQTFVANPPEGKSNNFTHTVCIFSSGRVQIKKPHPPAEPVVTCS
jgi:type IV fimbrial biogenesis protein FimT